MSTFIRHKGRTHTRNKHRKQVPEGRYRKYTMYKYRETGKNLSLYLYENRIKRMIEGPPGIIQH